MSWGGWGRGGDACRRGAVLKWRHLTRPSWSNRCWLAGPKPFGDKWVYALLDISPRTRRVRGIASQCAAPDSMAPPHHRERATSRTRPHCASCLVEDRVGAARGDCTTGILDNGACCRHPHGGGQEHTVAVRPQTNGKAEGITGWAYQRPPARCAAWVPRVLLPHGGIRGDSRLPAVNNVPGLQLGHPSSTGAWGRSLPSSPGRSQEGARLQARLGSVARRLTERTSALYREC